MANLNITNVKNETKESTDISAQKKYKIELQAEINKLRSKYQDYNKNPVKKEPEVATTQIQKNLIPNSHHSNARAANQNIGSNNKTEDATYDPDNFKM